MNGPIGKEGYTAYSFTETASANAAITFSYNTRGLCALDNVSVVANAIPTPEPSTAIVGLVGGLAMTGYVWRARRRAAHSAA